MAVRIRYGPSSLRPPRLVLSLTVGQDRYRLKILRGLYAKSNPDDWLSALQLALAYCKCPSSRGIEARVAHLLSTASVVSTFRRLVLRDSRQAYDKCCAELSTPDGSLTAYVERLVDPLSDHNADGSEKPLYDPGDPQAQVEWRPVRIIKSASALSLPFCQVYLRLLSDRDTKDSMAGDDHSNDVSTVEVLCDQLEQHEHVTHKTLVDIVEFLPDDKVEQVCPVLDAPFSVLCAPTADLGIRLAWSRRND